MSHRRSSRLLVVQTSWSRTGADNGEHLGPSFFDKTRCGNLRPSKACYTQHLKSTEKLRIMRVSIFQTAECESGWALTQSIGDHGLCESQDRLLYNRGIRETKCACALRPRRHDTKVQESMHHKQFSWLQQTLRMMKRYLRCGSFHMLHSSIVQSHVLGYAE